MQDAGVCIQTRPLAGWLGQNSENSEAKIGELTTQADPYGTSKTQKRKNATAGL